MSLKRCEKWDLSTRELDDDPPSSPYVKAARGLRKDHASEAKVLEKINYD